MDNIIRSIEKGKMEIECSGGEPNCFVLNEKTFELLKIELYSLSQYPTDDLMKSYQKLAKIWVHGLECKVSNLLEDDQIIIMNSTDLEQSRKNFMEATNVQE